MVSGCGRMRPHLAGAIGGAGPRICHSEERSDVGISCNSPRIRRGFLVIQLSTARLPRPLRGLAMTYLRTGAVGGAISGRHCPSERAIVKTATAPDLSLRGGRRPTWQSREGTSSSYKVPIKTYQPIASVAALTAQPLAALPPYGCGVPLAGSERLAGWQYSGRVFYGMRPPSLSFRGAKRRGNLGEAVAISPMAFPRSGRVLRDCHVGLWPPRNDTSGEYGGAPAPFCR